jgi:hypothetical protein
LDCDFDSLANVEVSESVDRACNSVFTGRLDPGEPCQSDIECAAEPDQDASCQDLEFDGYTVCVVWYRGTQGDPCYWTCTEQALTTTCNASSGEATAMRGECYTNEGLYCSVDGVCERQGAIGDPCAQDSGCAEGYCSFDSGECTALEPVGSACTSDATCREGLHCPDATCEPLLANGQPCLSSFDCQSGLCNEEVCADGDDNDGAVALLCGIVSGAFE